MNQKAIEDYTIEELEKLELQLWRAKDQYEANLRAVINDLNVIKEDLKKRQNDSSDLDI